MPIYFLLLDTKHSNMIMNIVIIIPINIKGKYQFISYLLTCRLNSTCSYFKTTAKQEHNIKITVVPNKTIQNRKYNINVRAVEK